MEDQDAEEIARALGISIENLRTKKHRIRAWINENYRDIFEDF